MIMMIKRNVVVVVVFVCVFTIDSESSYWRSVENRLKTTACIVELLRAKAPPTTRACQFLSYTDL
jgi:hypothetical protein